jgi:hypothetical protein
MMSPSFLTWNQRLTWIVPWAKARTMGRMARASAVCRRLMTIPKVGQLTALAFVAHPQSVDTPKRQTGRIGLISREGMAGLPIVLGNHRSPRATYVQSGRKGQAHTCDGIAQGDPDQRIASRLVVEVRGGFRRANNTHRNLQRAVQVGRAIGAVAVDGRRPSSRTVTSWASGSSDRRSREERHVRGDLPLANQVPHMLE